MHWADRVHYAFTALARFRLRSALILLAMGIGVAAMLTLTALGEGARRYIINEFASLGTNLLIVLPGRSETTGGLAGIFVPGVTRDLTVADAEAVRRLSHVVRVAPVIVGSAAVSYGPRDRDAPVLGTTHSLLALRHWSMAQGGFLPPGDPERASAVCVLGAQVKRELFGAANPLGQWVRIGERRYRVIGVMASEGCSIGVDVQDVVLIPVAAARNLFNTNSLFRILVEVDAREHLETVARRVEKLIPTRHQGERDVTVITQDAVLDTFDRILTTVTLAVGGIAAISLLVAGVLIMNVMLVSVSQRTAEIGLLKALGADRHQVVWLILTEAALLSAVGALLGMLLGLAASGWLRLSYPGVPFTVPPWALWSALLVAVVTGLAFGVMPARRAARLDPVVALRAE